MSVLRTQERATALPGKNKTNQFLRLAAAAQNDAVTLVKSESDLTIDSLLRFFDAGLQEFSLRREVQSVVQDTGPADCDELVSEGADFAVERQSFEIDVRSSQDGETWRLIAALLKVRRMLCDGWNGAGGYFGSDDNLHETSSQ
jgi:hypothetical protein